MKIKKGKLFKRRRQILFIGVCLLLLAGIIPVASNALSKDTIETKCATKISKFKKVEVTVNKGNTAWEIQSKLTPHEDTREMIYLDEVLNKKDFGSLKEGDTLIFLSE